MAREKSTDPDHRSYANVLLVQRVLAVLQAVNKLQAITVKGISDECGIPASSVVRILETLCAERFLVHVSRRGGYALASRICTLSSGFHGTPLVVEKLKSHVDELTRFHLWPFSVATLDRDAMVVEYSSIPLSPLAHARTTFHKRLSLLSRAHGLAYVSFCNSTERRHLLRAAWAANNPDDRVLAGAHSVRHLIGATRRRGYALRASDLDLSTQTIAVPILVEPGRVIATLGMTFFRSVVREPKIAEYAAVLKLTAAAAVERIREELAMGGAVMAEATKPPPVPDAAAKPWPAAEPATDARRALPPIPAATHAGRSRRTH